MEGTQTRLMAGMALALVIITGVLWYGDEQEEPADPDATATVWSVAADAVERVEITRAAGRLVLERAGDAWKVTEPDTFDADPARVKALLNALAAIDTGVPIEGGDAADFGLGATPAARVKLGLAGGGTAELSVGREAPVGFRTYAQVPGGGIVAVAGHPGDELLADAEMFRDRRVARFAPETVRRVTLTGPEGTLSVHGEGKAWWLDGFTRADANAVDDLVMDLLAVRFDEITGAPGLIVTPERTLQVETMAGPWTLRVGAPDGDGTPVEVDGGAAGRVSSEALAFLGMGPTDLGDSRVFPFDPERTTRIEVVRGEKRYAIDDTATGWTHDGKESPEATAIGAAVNDAAIRYRREPVPAITEPWLSVILHEGGRQRQVDLGQIVDGDFRVAQDKDGGAPYLAPAAEIAALEQVVR